jgi:hypothetical protein
VTSMRTAPGVPGGLHRLTLCSDCSTSFRAEPARGGVGRVGPFTGRARCHSCEQQSKTSKHKKEVLLFAVRASEGRMNLKVLWRRLLQRPLVLALILILAALAGYAGWVTAGGQAESKAAVVVVPPWSMEDENFKNPMLNLGDRATALASTLVVAIQRSDVGESVRGAGATSYEASNIGTDVRDPSRSAVILLTAIGPDERSAHNGIVRVINSSRTILKDMQQDAGTGDPPYMATLQVISQPQETTTFAARQIRSAAALAAVVLLGGVLIFWAIELIADRRSRSRERGIQLAFEDLMVDQRTGRHEELNGNSQTVSRASRRHQNV